MLSTNVVVSAPVGPFGILARISRTVVGAATSKAAAGDDSIVYVSMPPGTVSGGGGASVRNLADGAAIAVTMMDGGFDPVPLRGAVGDTLGVEVTLSGGSEVYYAVVPPRRPPTIVRTNPPKGKTDVPLNTQVIIVFSEPVDPSTVAAAVRLFDAGSPVDGAVTQSASRLVAAFAPASLLHARTVYQLVVDTSLKSSKGEALSSAVTVDFITGDQSFGGGFAAISAGVVSSCGLAADNTAYCWGTNDLGRVGDGTTADKLVPVPVTGGLHFSALRVASLQTCGLTTDGLAYCWGSNLFGALGSGTTTAPQMCYSADWADEGVGNQPCSPSPLPVSTALRFVALSSGASTTTCGLTAARAAYCWGYNRDGEIGSGAATTCSSPNDGGCSTVPVPVSGGLQFGSISSGGFHSCGVTTSGGAYCWGDNSYGQLGNGTTNSSSVPTPVDGTLRFTTVVTGAYHSCALTADGVAYCWGWNNVGQLGDGSNGNGYTPVPVFGARRFTALSTASWHTCGLMSNGDTYCWGQNSDGQLGDGTTTDRNEPVLVSGGLRLLAVSAGHRHTCGLSAGGSYCWGANDYGQFGDGTTTSSTVPVKAGLRP